MPDSIINGIDFEMAEASSKNIIIFDLTHNVPVRFRCIDWQLDEFSRFSAIIFHQPIYGRSGSYAWKEEQYFPFWHKKRASYKFQQC